MPVSRPGSAKIEVWRAPELLLDVPSKTPLGTAAGPSWRRLGPSWWLSGASGGHLGSVLGRLGGG